MWFLRSPLRRLLGWMVATAIAFFLDPANGARRRRQAFDTARGFVNSVVSRRRSTTPGPRPPTPRPPSLDGPGR